MKVFEIFPSINGEVTSQYQGSLCTFVRLAGCNLQCHYCFGIVKGSSNPTIITSRGPNKKLKDVSIGDFLMTFDKEMNLVETEIVDLCDRIVGDYLLIRIRDKKYYVTPDHPFFTTRGLVNAENLKEGDFILHSHPKDKISFNKTIENPMKNPEILRRKVLNTNYEEVGRKISAYRQINAHPKPFFTEESLRRISEANSGRSNGNWRGGKRKNYQYLKKKIRKGEINRCYKCGKTSIEKLIRKGKNNGLDVHHIDGDVNNDSMGNLVILCESCHYLEHKIGYNFWKNKRIDNKELVHPMYNGFKVLSITKIHKPLKVKSIKCSPHNSYLIDYMWVHNCDTTKAQGINSGDNYNVQEVFDIARSFKCPNITITGGEPLLQAFQLQRLVELFHNEWMTSRITIETNGSYEIPKGWPVECWVVDYKLLSSGETDKMMIWENNFRNMRLRDFVKFVIADKEDYEQALTVKKDLQKLGLRSRFAFSCINKGTVDCKWLVDRLTKDKQFDAIVNVQLHKLISVP